MVQHHCCATLDCLDWCRQIFLESPMRDKSKQSLLVFILLLALTLTYLTLQNFWNQKFASPSQLPFANLDPSNIEKIEFSFNGKSTSIEKREGKYLLTSFENVAADDAAVAEILSNLKSLKLGEAISVNKDKWPVFEVDEAKAIHLKLTHAGKISEIWIGKYASDFTSTYLRIGTDQKTYATDREIRNSLVKDSYADLNLVDLKSEEIIELEFKYQTQSFVLAKENGLWKSSGNARTEINAAKINDLLRKLSSLKANNILPKEKIQESSFRYPFLALRLKSENATAEVVIDTKNKEGDYLTKTNRAPYLYTLSPFNLEGLPKTLKELEE